MIYSTGFNLALWYPENAKPIFHKQALDRLAERGLKPLCLMFRF